MKLGEVNRVENLDWLDVVFSEAPSLRPQAGRGFPVSSFVGWVEHASDDAPEREACSVLAAVRPDLCVRLLPHNALPLCGVPLSSGRRRRGVAVSPGALVAAGGSRLHVEVEVGGEMIPEPGGERVASEY